MKHLSVPPKLIMDSVVQGFESSHASRKLIILGLVGTISEKYRSHTRRDSYSRFSKVNPEIRNYLKELSSDPLTTVLIISSRDQETCEKACAGTDAILAAENGFYVKHPGEEHWTVHLNQLSFVFILKLNLFL